MKINVLHFNDDVKSYELNKFFMQLPLKQHLIHEVVVAERSAQRQATHSVKTRAEVSGTGKKPWKQKGTGLARHGSKRSPIWIKGGVAHGPKTNRNYKLKTNKKVVQYAFVNIFNMRCEKNQVSVIGNVKLDKFSTKKMVELFNKCEYQKARRLLLVVNFDEISKELLYSVNNLPNVLLKRTDQVSVLDLISHDRVVFTLQSLKNLEELMLQWNCMKSLKNPS